MIYVKKELRRAVRARIKELDPEYIAASDAGICDAVCSLEEIASAPVVLAYWSTGREADTHAIVEKLAEQGKTVALPVSRPDGQMSFFEYTGRMKTGLYGIPEPEDGRPVIPEKGAVIIVPALAFDAGGFRLGQGGGYYDRFLAANEVFAVGVGREELLLDKTPAEPHDRPVNVLVTETRILRLR